MKKALFIVFLCSVVMLLSVPQATALDTAPTINVQVSIEEAGIDLSGYNWTTGTLALSATASSPPFTVTNIGTVPVDLTIDSGDTMWQAPQTGPDWTCSVSGPNTFAMGFDIAGTAPGTDICPGGVSLAAGVLPGDPFAEPQVDPGTATFYLHFQAPSLIDQPFQSIQVTVTATP